MTTSDTYVIDTHGLTKAYAGKAVLTPLPSVVPIAVTALLSVVFVAAALSARRTACRELAQ